MTYVIATLLAGAATTFCVQRWPGLAKPLDRILAWLIMFPAVIMATTLVLGLSGLLSPGMMVGTVAGLAVISGAVWVRKRNPVRLDFGAALSALRHPWYWPLIAAGAVLVGWQTYVALLAPPFAWDALSYHLPPAVWWLQAGRIYPVPTQFTFGYGYPQGWSLLLLWQLAFTVTDRLVNIVQLPFLALGIFAAYGLARNTGVGRRWSGWAALFWGLSPLVLEQLTVPYNDLSVAALTMAAFYFVMRFWRTADRPLGLLSLVGIASGLILSIKPNGFLVLAFLGLFALWPVMRPWGAYVRSVLIRALAIGLPCFFLAGYWYIRNLVLYHNPLFPARVSFLGHTIFPGPRTITSLINVTPDQTTIVNLALSLNEYVPRYTYDSPTGGFGAVFTCLGIGALLVAGVHALYAKRWWTVAVLAVGGIMFLLQPFKYPRYSLFLPALAGLAFGYLLQRFAGRLWRTILQGSAVVLILLTLVLVPFQPQMTSETLLQLRTARAEGRSISSAEFGLARIYAFIDNDAEFSHPENRIAYTEGSFVYPLMGRNRDNVIYYVPTDKGFEPWLKQILERQTTFLIIGADGAIEDQWAKTHPERFVPFMWQWPFTVYLVRSDLPRNQTLLQHKESHP